MNYTPYKVVHRSAGNLAMRRLNPYRALCATASAIQVQQLATSGDSEISSRRFIPQAWGLWNAQIPIRARSTFFSVADIGHM